MGSITPSAFIVETSLVPNSTNSEMIVHPLSSYLKPVSHDGTFLSTCHATMTKTLRDKLQWGSHTLRTVTQRGEK